MNILIIDDLMKDASLIKNSLLENKGDLEIIIETNSVKAKETLSSEVAKNIDLLILDLQMPKVDGIQILNFMEENKINIPVIVCSNFIEQYKNSLCKSKVVQTFSKKKFSSISHTIMAEIFLQINSIKSCMVLDERISNYKNKKKYSYNFYESLNELKKELQKL